MAAVTETPKKKGVDINVLHCLDPGCSGLLAYEVDSDNVLYLDLSWTAHRDGDVLYFPCPKCGGRNIIEPFTTDKGKDTHRVVRFEAR